MLSINIMATFGLVGTVMAVPYHGHHHHTRLHRSYGSAPVGTASGFAPFPYPSANGTGIWGSTGSGGPTAASSPLSTYMVPTPLSSVEGPASSSNVAASPTPLSSVEAPASSSNVAASPVGPAEESVTLENYGALTSTCTTAITVTSTEKVYVTVTPSFSSSAGRPTSTLTVQSTIVVPSSSVAAASTMAPANSSAIYSASSGYAPYPANSTSIMILSTAAADNGRYHRHSTWSPSYSSASIAASSLQSSVLTASSSVPVSSSAAATTTSMSSAYVAPTTSSTASSSAPASSSGSGKRGLAYNDATLTECFEGSNEISWAYNWASSSSGLSSSFKFIPTLWGASSDFTNSWNANAKAAIASGSTHLMSFNEPDLSSQSNLSPQAAADAYRTWMMPFANTGVKLGAPSVTNGGGSMGLTWLQNFMSACSDCQIDFVNIHWYDSYSNIDYFKSHVQSANTISGGKPVFVSEFGCTDGSADDISGFLKTVMPWMDSQSYVEGYAYFMVSSGLLVNGNTPSTYGSTYMSYTA